MKPFTWGTPAIQAHTSEGLRIYDSYEDPEEEFNKMGIKTIDCQGNSAEKFFSPWALWSVRARTDVERQKIVRRSYYIDSVIDARTHPTEPRDFSPNHIYTRNLILSPDSLSLTTEIPVLQKSKIIFNQEPNIEPLGKPSLDFHLATVRHIPKGQIEEAKKPAPTSLHSQLPSQEIPETESLQPNSDDSQKFKDLRERSSTSIIFENLHITPITIVLTTPDNESPTQSPSPQWQSLTASVLDFESKPNPIITVQEICDSSTPFSNASSTTLHYLPVRAFDNTRLMPPNTRASDAQRTRKAQELHYLRQFMIQLMNTKGSTLPTNLRIKMMNMYAIRDGDLRPETVAKFKMNEETINNVQDEGVAFGQVESHKQDRQILEVALRSQWHNAIPKKPSVFQPPRSTKAMGSNRAQDIPANKLHVSSSPSLIKAKFFCKQTKSRNQKTENELPGENLPVALPNKKDQSINWCSLISPPSTPSIPIQHRLSLRKAHSTPEFNLDIHQASNSTASVNTIPVFNPTNLKGNSKRGSGLGGLRDVLFPRKVGRD